MAQKSVPTVTKHTVQLVLGQEREPADTFLLVLSKFRIDGHGDRVWFHLGSIEQLRKELPLRRAFFQQVLREAGGIRKTSLRERNTVRLLSISDGG